MFGYDIISDSYKETKPCLIYLTNMLFYNAHNNFTEGLGKSDLLML